jgi:SAM-dependent methyltransferase
MASERLYLVGHHPGPEERQHLDRYRFALSRIGAGSTVLDAACGSGYGSEVLADKAGRVIGLDISEDAIRYALEHHRRKNIEFAIADLGTSLNLSSESCDAVVCLETLEHVANQDVMLKEFQRVLRRGGVIILSTPDREVISDQAHEENEFHIAERSKSELVALLSEHFEIEELHGQILYRPSFWNHWLKAAGRLDRMGLRRFLLKFWPIQEVLSRWQSEGTVDIQPTVLTGAGWHFYLVAVAKRR